MNNKIKTIWGTSFHDCKKYLDHIKNIHQVGERIKDSFVEKDLIKVFANHPFKKLYGKEQKVFVAKHPFYKTKCFLIKDENHKYFYFSSSNLKQENKINFLEELNKILRRIVSSDIVAAKSFLLKNNGPYCAIQNCKLDSSSLVVDHKPPYNFNLIVNAWIRDREIFLNKDFFDLNVLGELDIKDNNLKIDFKSFHKKMSSGYLRLVEKKLNNSNGAKFKLQLPKHEMQQKQIQLF